MGALQHAHGILQPVETPVQIHELAGQDPISQRLAQRRILIECPNDFVNRAWTRHAVQIPRTGAGRPGPWFVVRW